MGHANIQTDTFAGCSAHIEPNSSLCHRNVWLHHFLHGLLAAPEDAPSMEDNGRPQNHPKIVRLFCHW
jgi:hypothetical protein